MPFENVTETVRRRMARIKKTNTAPELLVRRTAHRLGFRYRLHQRRLPGTPDLVFPKLSKIVFVNGCFWHRHDCVLAGELPSVRRDYWLPKFARIVERDREVATQLTRLGWSVLVIWECETRAHEVVEQRLYDFLSTK